MANPGSGLRLACGEAEFEPPSATGLGDVANPGPGLCLACGEAEVEPPSATGLCNVANPGPGLRLACEETEVGPPSATGLCNVESSRKSLTPSLRSFPYRNVITEGSPGDGGTALNTVVSVVPTLISSNSGLMPFALKTMKSSA